MAKVKPAKREVTKVAELLSSDEYNTPEDMASAVIDLVYNQLMPKRFKHVVVGQLRPRDPHDAEEGSESKVAFGPFPTAGTARAAGESLAISRATGDTARWWYLELFDGTPSEFYKQLKKKHQLDAIFDNASPHELRYQMQVAWFQEHPGEDLPPELQGNGWNDLEWFELFKEDFKGLLVGEESDDGTVG